MTSLPLGTQKVHATRRFARTGLVRCVYRTLLLATVSLTHVQLIPDPFSYVPYPKALPESDWQAAHLSITATNLLKSASSATLSKQHEIRALHARPRVPKPGTKLKEPGLYFTATTRQFTLMLHMRTDRAQTAVARNPSLVRRKSRLGIRRRGAHATEENLLLQKIEADFVHSSPIRPQLCDEVVAIFMDELREERMVSGDGRTTAGDGPYNLQHASVGAVQSPDDPAAWTDGRQSAASTVRRNRTHA